MYLRCISSFLFFLLLTLPTSKAQELQFSLLTCDSGDELYSTFGHSALRLQQKGMGVDMVFNYGMFDPRVEGFYLKFMRRDLPYYLDATEYRRFINEYTYDKRSVREQILDLDSLQAATLAAALQVNFRKENRFYAYDFFYDNCSTRIEDIIQESVSDSVDYGQKFNENATLRNLLDEHLQGKPWSDFGIDIVIGARADKVASIEEQMFLPNYLYKYYQQSSLGEHKLVRENKLILDYTKEGELRNQYPWYYTPLTLFSVLLFLEVMLFIFYRNHNSIALILYDKAWYFLLFFISLIIIFLWFFTAHEATKANWNLLWISPLYILLIVSKWAKSNVGKYIKMSLIALNLLCIIGWLLLPQQFHIAFLPMLIISLLKILREVSSTSTKV